MLFKAYGLTDDEARYVETRLEEMLQSQANAGGGAYKIRDNDAERAILDALGRHGLSPEASEAVLRLGYELRARTLVDGLEHAGLVDATSGALMGAILTGQEHQVDIAPSLRRVAPGRRCVLIHTHPGSSSFSPEDGLMLVADETLSCTAAVGADGTWYLLSKVEGREPPHAAQLRFAYGIEHERLRRAYFLRAAQGELTPRAAQLAYIDAVWRNIAPLLMLRYDRVQPEV